MRKIFCVTYLVFLLFSYGDCGLSRSLSNEDMKECYFRLLCELNRIEDFQETAGKIDPQLTEKIWIWIEEIESVKGPNIIENWSKYKAVACNNPEEMKEKRFNEFFQKGSEYWLEVCMNVLSKNCKSTEESVMMMVELFERHFENGNCEKKEVSKKSGGRNIFG
ncbi:hypothetical protein AVEN_234209-1 [Araneus ventricosus]|uniref:Uncharacterized protein n=1 Tax=Araneus ventricosus TaxID=182803 RepID=A0A4Y2A7Q0_ARAVE|nr:hypothetical protein AVEN_234209-1 [Araneus ventricosus]